MPVPVAATMQPANAAIRWIDIAAYRAGRPAMM
jgi:hypothetical protein